MDEEKLIDRILRNESLPKALYKLGYIHELKQYLKSVYNPSIEIMLNKGIDKKMIIDYLNNRRIILNALSNIDTHIRSVRLKASIISYIYVIALSILIPIILTLNFITPSFITNTNISSSILFATLLSYGIGQIIIAELILTYISISHISYKKLIFKSVLYVVLSVFLLRFYTHLISTVLPFK